MAGSKLETFISSVQKPADFDDFWLETLRDVDKVGSNVRMTSAPMRSTDEVDVFEVHYDSYGRLSIAGWFCRPRKGQGPYPGLLLVPGYVSEPELPKAWASQGYATFSVAPRGKLRSNSKFNPGYPGLLTHNIDDRDTYGYRGFYMDAVRAFDVLREFDDVDSDRIGVYGGSQGGALTLLVSALRSNRVTVAAAQAPYLCSMMDAAALTRSYPYEEINDYLRIYPEREAIVRDVLSYYDIQNFVSGITCPIIVGIGLKDDVCPPQTGFAVFEAIGSTDKRLFPHQDCGHDAGIWIGHAAVVQDFLKLHLQL